MGMLSLLLGFPVTMPLAGIGWVAGQVAAAVEAEALDPARVEGALLALERRLEAGEIDEAAFEAAEAELLAELSAIRAARGAA